TRSRRLPWSVALGGNAHRLPAGQLVVLHHEVNHAAVGLDGDGRRASPSIARRGLGLRGPPARSGKNLRVDLLERSAVRSHLVGAWLVVIAHDSLFSPYSERPAGGPTRLLESIGFLSSLLRNVRSP